MEKRQQMWGNPHDPGFVDAHLTECQGGFLARNMRAGLLSRNSVDAVFSSSKESGDGDQGQPPNSEITH
jgi:hypothetical protein